VLETWPLTCANVDSTVGGRWTFPDVLRTVCGLPTHDTRNLRHSRDKPHSSVCEDRTTSDKYFGPGRHRGAVALFGEAVAGPPGPCRLPRGAAARRQISVKSATAMRGCDSLGGTRSSAPRRMAHLAGTVPPPCASEAGRHCATGGPTWGEDPAAARPGFRVIGKASDAGFDLPLVITATGTGNCGISSVGEGKRIILAVGGVADFPPVEPGSRSQ
jgi:hypothetical protein